MTITLIVETDAKADLLRLYKYLLERAEHAEDLAAAEGALQAINAAMNSLATTPFLFRKAAGSRGALCCELVMPFDASLGASGYVLKYEIASTQLVVVLAVRHQHEEDFR